MSERFPITSRYYLVETATLVTGDGQTVAYLRRRFVPQPESFDTLELHSVVDGDRIDNLAAHYLGDPEQSWRLCDGNRAMRPAELTEKVGRKLRITLPDGVRGPVL